MPNHITTIIKFQGAQTEIDKLKKRIAGNEECPVIDFNQISPIPTELIDATSGSNENIAKYIMSDCGNEFGIGQDRVDTENSTLVQGLRNNGKIELARMIKNLDLSKMNEPEWEKFSKEITNNFELIQNLLEQEHISCEDTLSYLNNKRRFGTTSWYNWCCARWGTKWNAYSQSDNGNEIQFDTAWSCPEPILQEISRIFPTVQLEVLFADEDIGSNCGILILENGDIVNYVDKSGDGEFACNVKGYDYDEYMSEMEDFE